MLKPILMTACACYLAIVLLLYLFQRNLMYLPGVDLGTPEHAGVPEMRIVTSVADDGIEAVSWYATPAADGRVVILFHGNAGTIADRAYKARHFIDAGYGVLLVGYRGFGGNPGTPSEKGLYADARGALSWLEGQGIEPGRWVIYGESLGTGVAVQTAVELKAAERPVDAVVLEAPFTSMADAAAVHYPWLPARYLVRDRYDSLSKIRDIGTRLLVTHGTADRTVPVKLGRELFDRARFPKHAIWLEGAGHVDLYDFDLLDPMLFWLREPGDRRGSDASPRAE